MPLGQLQLYQNPNAYPLYKRNITELGQAMDCTPVGISNRGGTLQVKGSFAKFMNANYLSFSMEGKTFYGWITNVTFGTPDNYTIEYEVDPWRTWQNSINLGVQFIDRAQTPTNKRDDMLGSDQAYPDIETQLVENVQSDYRVLVVQARPGKGTTWGETPVQPQPYEHYLVNYNIYNWSKNNTIKDLQHTLLGMGETTNISTMYSIPYMNLSNLPGATLYVEDGTSSTPVGGFKVLGGPNAPKNKRNAEDRLHREIPLTFNTDISELMKVDHSVQIVVPGGGIIKVPDELLNKGGLSLRQDVDLFSGASNWMLTTGNKFLYAQSVRGMDVSSIPILSDPKQTYISQNHSSLMTSMVGDVASVAGGLALSATGAGAFFGGGVVATGITGITDTMAGISDADNKAQNPPAFMGPALANNYNNTPWIIITKRHVTNKNKVNQTFGYPVKKVDNLTFPNSGYIKTQGCAVGSDGTVPAWAIEKINELFNSGMLIS